VLAEFGARVVRCLGQFRGVSLPAAACVEPGQHEGRASDWARLSILRVAFARADRTESQVHFPRIFRRCLGDDGLMITKPVASEFNGNRICSRPNDGAAVSALHYAVQAPACGRAGLQREAWKEKIKAFATRIALARRPGDFSGAGAPPPAQCKARMCSAATVEWASK